MSMDREHWNGRRVLITGHTGFKGGWLSLWLTRMGAETVGFALEPPSQPSFFETARLGEILRSVHGDVRDLAAVTRIVEETRPEVVFHLAAQSLVRPSYEAPVETYATNVMGTAHVLEAARKSPSVRAVVVVTTDKCYENREWVWPYRESDPVGGFDPYSSSKGCAELVTTAYRRSFFATEGPAVASARAGNVIGGGDWGRDRLIPDLMRGALEGRETRIRSPSAVRPWQHVLEPLAGYLRLAERLWHDGRPFAEAWNFGPEDSDTRTVGWVVEHLAQRWGADLRFAADQGDHPHEAHTLRLDSSKARTRLGWRPRLRLADALDWLADWYRAYGENGDVRRLSEEQIARYEALEDAS